MTYEHAIVPAEIRNGFVLSLSLNDAGGDIIWTDARSACSVCPCRGF